MSRHFSANEISKHSGGIVIWLRDTRTLFDLGESLSRGFKACIELLVLPSQGERVLTYHRDADIG